MTRAEFIEAEIEELARLRVISRTLAERAVQVARTDHEITREDSYMSVTDAADLAIGMARTGPT